MPHSRLAHILKTFSLTVMSESPYSSPREAAVPPPLPQAQGNSVRIGDDAGIRLLIPVGRSAWAIAAGYLGLFSMVAFPAPLAVIISVIAIRDIRRSRNSPQVKHGMGRAVFGLVMGIVGSLILGAIIISVMRGKS